MLGSCEGKVIFRAAKVEILSVVICGFALINFLLQVNLIGEIGFDLQSSAIIHIHIRNRIELSLKIGRNCLKADQIDLICPQTDYQQNKNKKYKLFHKTSIYLGKCLTRLFLFI